jgi:hypothetical protein
VVPIDARQLRSDLTKHWKRGQKTCDENIDLGDHMTGAMQSLRIAAAAR